MIRTMVWAPLALLAALTHLVSADVEFTRPKAGAREAGGGAIIVEWKDSGDSPPISDLLNYQLFLCAGGNEASQRIELPIIQGAAQFSTTGNAATGTVSKGFGASTPQNAYYLKMVSVAAKGGTIINYSSRFSLTGMEGVFPANVLEGLKTVSGTAGPEREDGTANPAIPAAGGDFDVPYAMQTGTIRFAPMQPIPPTKITKKNAAPLFPTSSVAIATTFLPTPKIQTTITQSQTFSVSSRENTAAPAPMPTDDMGKFLNRWKD